MDIIYVILPLSILLGLIGLIAYIWSAKNQQFKDLQGSALRMLHEEKEKK